MRSVIFAVLMFVISCSASKEPAPVADPETARDLAAGKIVGFSNETGAHVWRGLPFAAPPVGELRWRAPRPAVAWQGERQALEFGAECTQLTNVYSVGEKQGTIVGSEDCLYLNVFAPSMSAQEAAAANFPVMVWVHGGGNVWGSAAPYDFSALAARENVIVLTVQYRLGPFGWFAYERLAEGSDLQADQSANFGTLDLIAALEWVQENASAFGGDPARVTVFGESAGGHNTVALLASPMAKGLFHRAIVQSGSFDSFSFKEAWEGELSANPAKSILKTLGTEDPSALRQISAEDVFAAYGAAGTGGFLELPRIIEDGVALPEGPLRGAFRSTENFNAVPIITGTNRDEMKLFQILDPAYTRRFFGTLVQAKDPEMYQATSDYQSRLWRVRAVDWPADQMAGAGHTEVYAYRFDWDDAGSILFSDFEFLFGATHSVEIPFITGDFEFFGPLDRFLFRKSNEADRLALSATMMAYWASFARDGKPSAPGEADWQAYTEGPAPFVLRLDAPSDGGVEAIKEGDSFERLFSDLRGDSGLSSDEQCQIVDGMAVWVPQEEAQYKELSSC